MFSRDEASSLNLRALVTQMPVSILGEMFKMNFLPAKSPSSISLKLSFVSVHLELFIQHLAVLLPCLLCFL